MSEPLFGLSAAQRAAIDAEIARLQAQLETADTNALGGVNRVDHTSLLVASTIVLAVIAVAAIVTIFLTRPDKDNTAIVATLMGFLVPLMTALLAAAVQQVHSAINGRLTQLLRVTAARSRAEGMLAQATEAAAMVETKRLQALDADVLARSDAALGRSDAVLVREDARMAAAKKELP